MSKKRDIEGNRLHHFELSDQNRTVRWVLIILLLVVAAVSLTYGLMSALQTPAGWQTIESNATGLHCGDEFVLQYEYGAGEASATVESKKLEPLYAKLTEDAWKLFFNDAGSTDLSGIYAINQHLNEEIVVDENLYLALKQFVESGNRALYLGPVYTEYDRIFYSDNVSIAQDCDPGQDADQRAYVQTLADFARDAQAIQLVLGEDNKVMLRVSQEYLTYAKENEIRYLIDFGWMRNAFVVDYMASALIENGFTNGYIASVDGFTRNLDSRGNGYSMNLFNMGQAGVDLAAVMNYTGPKSLIFLRSYPLDTEDMSRYYIFDSGRIVTSLIDLADGQSKSSKENLVSYSDALGCGQLALSVMSIFITDEFSADAVNALTEQGIYSVWFEENRMMYNENDINITFLDPEYQK